MAVPTNQPNETKTTQPNPTQNKPNQTKPNQTKPTNQPTKKPIKGGVLRRALSIVSF
jgi:hypothetical protein